MIIAISGSGGFIGKKCTSYFAEKGWLVKAIPRISAGTETGFLAEVLGDADVVLNLSGATIARRWSKTYMKIIYDSRILTTRKLAEAILAMPNKPQLFISTSATGIYSSAGNHTETDWQPGNDFLASLCADWEGEALKAEKATRVAIIRLGVVLGNGGGFLNKLLPIFRLGLGGRIGNGRQAFSWIHIRDLLRATEFIIQGQEFSGVFNLTSPHIIDNQTFTRTLSQILKRPAYFIVPVFLLRIIFGEGYLALTSGQAAYPEKLLRAGFDFDFPDLYSTLKEIVTKK